METSNEFSRWFVHQRRLRHWSIREVARRADLSTTAISSYELKGNIPLPDQALRIAAVFEMSEPDIRDLHWRAHLERARLRRASQRPGSEYTPAIIYRWKTPFPLARIA